MLAFCVRETLLHYATFNLFRWRFPLAQAAQRVPTEGKFSFKQTFNSKNWKDKRKVSIKSSFYWGVPIPQAELSVHRKWVKEFRSSLFSLLCLRLPISLLRLQIVSSCQEHAAELSATASCLVHLHPSVSKKYHFHLWENIINLTWNVTIWCSLYGTPGSPNIFYEISNTKSYSSGVGSNGFRHCMSPCKYWNWGVNVRYTS